MVLTHLAPHSVRQTLLKAIGVKGPFFPQEGAINKRNVKRTIFPGISFEVFPFVEPFESPEHMLSRVLSVDLLGTLPRNMPLRVQRLHPGCLEWSFGEGDVTKH